jgi:hypothetical protein
MHHEWAAFFVTPGSKAPVGGADGAVYARAPIGPSSLELAKAALKWFLEHRPEVLWSKVERMFAEKGRKIIWTPPYAHKFQPIELVWGVGKKRAGCMCFKGRDLATTRAHLRIGWYGGSGRGRTFEKCNVRGCWETALRETQAWIDKNLNYTAQRGISGVLGEDLANVANWTRTDATFLDIKDMDIEEDEVVAELVREVGNEREVLEDAGVQIAAVHLGGEGPDPMFWIRARAEGWRWKWQMGLRA